MSYKFQEKGITLVEIIIAIFIIVLFSAILIADFPKILRQFALSRATYKLAQDFRKAQDLGLSGVQIADNPIEAKGYGVYFNLIDSDREYIVYADEGNQEYGEGDYPLETINISDTNPDLYIKGFQNINGDLTSINFSPPNPTIKIQNHGSQIEVGIVLGLRSDASLSRTVWINISGLIRVE